MARPLRGLTIFLPGYFDLPRSKHLHLFATLFNDFFRNYGPKGVLPLTENIEECDH
jgi:hypothetical protein